MAELARVLPTYTLDMGQELDPVPEILAGLLDRGGA